MVDFQALLTPEVTRLALAGLAAFSIVGILYAVFQVGHEQAASRPLQPE